MQEHECIFDFKARYYTLGEITKDTKQIWFVLHGYGQLAGYFIRNFKVIHDRGVFIIAPEGLSRFYLDDMRVGGRASDRVGATWMTKENRLKDIENYLQFLNAVYFQQLGDAQPVPVTVLGFSQGAATASRWVTAGQIHFSRLILWSGVFPPDMKVASGKKVLQEKETYLVYGKNDPLLNENHFSEMQLISTKLQIEPKVVAFDGQHEIDEKTLLSFL